MSAAPVAQVITRTLRGVVSENLSPLADMEGHWAWLVEVVSTAGTVVVLSEADDADFAATEAEAIAAATEAGLHLSRACGMRWCGVIIDEHKQVAS